MRIESRVLNLLYIAVFVTITSYGLYLALGMNQGEFLFLPLSYSNLSNMICLVYFFVCLIHGIVILIFKNNSEEISIMPRLKGAVTMCVTITLLIFHFLLSRGSVYIPGTSTVDWRNVIIHYLTPILAIIHWLVFDKKGFYKKKDPVYWIAIPIGYLIYSLIYAEIGPVFFYNDTVRYPYFFINPEIVGWFGVVSSVAVLVAFFIMLGHFVLFLDKHLESLENERNVT